MESGTKLGHYTVASLIGKGGMGEVYQATDEKLGRQVAIKVLPEEFAKDAERLARFEREAKLLASLNHPNIAAIYGLEENEGTRLLVLELVEGDTLADQIRRGPIGVEQSLKLALQIAEALEAAHEKGVIHRDLKPANIKVTPDGKVKVLDFGLAKAFAGDESGVDVAHSPTLSMQATQQGVILGTAAYMSPEQTRGRDVDKRTDVWAFGCVLYEMLTGRSAFQGEDVTEILASVIKTRADLDLLPAHINPAVSKVLSRCLEKDTNKRFRDIGDVQYELEQVSADPGGIFTKPSEGVQAATQSKLPWLAAIIAGMVVAGVTVWSLRAPEPGRVSRFDYELPEEINFRNTGRPVLAISPNGEHFVYNGTEGLYLRSIDALEARLIPGTEAVLTNPVFSPDGQEVAYFQSGLTKISVSGGAPVTLAEPITNPFGMSWEQDGTILYGQGDRIWQVSENGGEPVHLIATEDGEQAHGPQLLPGGEWLLFTLTRSIGATRWDEADIVIESLSTGERRVLRSGGSDARYAPTGHLVYAFSDVLFALPSDVDSLELSGGPVPIVQGVRRAEPPAVTTGAAFYSFSDSGTLVYVPGRDAAGASRNLVFLDREGNAEIVSDQLGDYIFPRFSPDDTRIAVEIDDDDGPDIWIYEIETDVLNQLTFDGGGRPVWTPDGTELTYLSGDELWIVASDFSGSPTLLPGTEAPANQGPGGWSPDGTVLLFASDEGIHAWREDDTSGDVSETAELIVTIADGALVRHPEFSPDGRWFVYTSNETGRGELYANPYPVGVGGRQRITTDGGSAPVWVRERQELIYQGPAPSLSLEVVGISTEPTLARANPTALFTESEVGVNLATDFRRNFDVSADGQRFIVSPALADVNQAAASPQINIVLNWFEELTERVPVA